MKAFVIVLSLFSVSCTKRVDAEALHAVEAFGFTDARVTRFRTSDECNSPCGKYENAVYYVAARNPAHNPVNVLVCCGGGQFSDKGCTVRTMR
jgi:hypothetical protein